MAPRPTAPRPVTDLTVDIRWKAFVDILHGKTKPIGRTATIGDVMRWHGVSAKTLHSLEERRIIRSGRGASNVRVYEPADQARIEIALTLRELEGGLDDIRRYLDLRERDLEAANAALHEVLEERADALRRRQDRMRATMITLSQREREGPKRSLGG